MLVAVPVLHGIAYAFASTATMAVAQSAIPPERRAEGTGYYALGSTLATALGPAIGLMIVGHFDYPTLFWVSLTVSIVGLLLGAVLHRTTGRLSFAVHPAPVQEAVPAEPARGAVNRPTFSGRDIAHPAVLPIGAFMLVIGLCYAGVITYLNAYSVERGVVAGAGLFFIAYATAMFVMRFVLGKLQDRRGDNVVVYLGIVFFASALALLAVAEHDWHVVVAGALTGLGYGTLMPASQAIAVRVVPADKLGTGISTLLLLADVGIGLGPIVLGFVVTGSGYGVMFATLAVLVLLAAGFYHLVHGRLPVARPRV